MPMYIGIRRCAFAVAGVGAGSEVGCILMHLFLPPVPAQWDQ